MDILKNGNLEDEPPKPQPSFEDFELSNEEIQKIIKKTEKMFEGLNLEDISNNVNFNVADMGSMMKDLCNAIPTLNIGGNLNDLLKSAFDGEVLEPIEASEVDNADNSYLSSPYFFKRIALENMGNILDGFKIGEVNQLANLLTKGISKYSFFPFVTIGDKSIDTLLQEMGYGAFIVIEKNKNYAILKIGAIGTKKTSFYMVLYKEAGEYKMYIPTWKAPINVDEEEETLTISDTPGGDYLYNVTQEIRTLFMFPKPSSVMTLANVGSVIMDTSVAKEDDFIRLGSISFKDSAEASLIKKDLELSDEIETVPVYGIFKDPETGIERTTSATEVAALKEYLRFINNYDLEGKDCFEGRFNIPEVAKNLEVKIMKNRVVIVIDIGRVTF
jgi:hypothetical protein